jgi:hypothetical protein
MSKGEETSNEKAAHDRRGFLFSIHLDGSRRGVG